MGWQCGAAVLADLGGILMLCVFVCVCVCVCAVVAGELDCSGSGVCCDRSCEGLGELDLSPLGL
jgi:hypothetical protein